MHGMTSLISSEEEYLKLAVFPTSLKKHGVKDCLTTSVLYFNILLTQFLNHLFIVLSKFGYCLNASLFAQLQHSTNAHICAFG